MRMSAKKPAYKKTAAKAAFKPCRGCPAPAKCRAAKKCLKKG